MIIRYCKTCGCAVRSSKAKIADAPGTRAPGGKGDCAPCYRAAGRALQIGSPDPRTVHDLEVFMRRVKRAGASKSPLIRHLPVRSEA